MPRISAIQRNRANVPAVTPQQCWYRALYLPLVDHLIQELNNRLLNHNDRFLGQYLIPTNKIYNAYSNDLSHRVAFDNKIVRWKAKWALAEGEKPNNLEDTLNDAVLLASSVFYLDNRKFENMSTDVRAPNLTQCFHPGLEGSRYLLSAGHLPPQLRPCPCDKAHLCHSYSCLTHHRQQQKRHFPHSFPP